MDMKEYRYFAFISYKSDDLNEAWALKKKLDGYKLPTLLRKQYGKERKPTCEAFLDKTNIQPGDLTQELKSNLDNSHYLIVVCSPCSAKSEYVSAEIEWFTRNGREHEMFLYIVDSDPARIEDSFNPAIMEAAKRWSERDVEKREILGVNIKEKDVDKMFFIYRWPIIGPWLLRERAYMQLISKLLTLEFDQLWSYQKIRLIERVIAWIAGILLFVSAVAFTWHYNQPVDVTIGLVEKSVHNENLPPLKDAVVTIEFGDKIEVDTIRSIENSAIFKEIARKHMNSEARMMVECRNYLPVDTTLLLTNNVDLHIRRDSTVYGDVHFKLWNLSKGCTVANIEVEIAGRKVTSDQDGLITLFVPLHEQETTYVIKTSVPLADNNIYLPCGPTDYVVVLN